MFSALECSSPLLKFPNACHSQRRFFNNEITGYVKFIYRLSPDIFNILGL